MALSYVRILNIEILSVSKVELLPLLKEGVHYTPNIDHLVKLQANKEFYQAYQKADWVVCDSRILLFASRLLKISLKEAIPGSSFFPSYYEYHKNNKDIRIFLLGAADGVAAKARDNINRKVGREMVVGAHSPSFGFEKNVEECHHIIELINRSNANVLVVGVGAPKQENWIFQYRERFTNVKLFMALGATIDFEARHVPRAPALLQKYGFEWLYRLVKEPQRLWKRYLIEDVKFFYFFGKQLACKYRDPFIEG